MFCVEYVYCVGFINNEVQCVKVEGYCDWWMKIVYIKYEHVIDEYLNIVVI